MEKGARDVEDQLRQWYDSLDLPDGTQNHPSRLDFRALALRHAFAVAPHLVLPPSTPEQWAAMVEVPHHAALTFIERYRGDLWCGKDLSKGSVIAEALVHYFFQLFKAPASPPPNQELARFLQGILPPEARLPRVTGNDMEAQLVADRQLIDDAAFVNARPAVPRSSSAAGRLEKVHHRHGVLSDPDSDELVRNFDDLAVDNWISDAEYQCSMVVGGPDDSLCGEIYHTPADLLAHYQDAHELDEEFREEMLAEAVRKSEKQ